MYACMIIISSFSTLLLFEYVSLVNEWGKKPSYYITSLGRYLGRFFQKCGEIFAWSSSFISEMLAYLHLELMLQACSDLILSILVVLESPLYTIDGYMKKIKSYAYPYIIPICSILMVTALIAMIPGSRYLISTEAHRLYCVVIKKNTVTYMKYCKD